jgi:multiple sugar transport system substrate-binding protein
MIRVLVLRSVLIAALCFSAASGARAVEIAFFQRGYVEGGRDAATQLTDAAVAAFEKRNPQIQVRVVGVPWEADGDLKLRAALLARKQIDCFRLAHDQLPAFIPTRRRLLSSVGPFLTPADRADFGASTLAGVTFGGEVMAWPLWSTATILLARTDILAARGIEIPLENEMVRPCAK